MDEFTRREALDRASFVCDLVGNVLLEHPFIRADTRLRAKIEDALAELAEVRAEIAAQRCPLFPGGRR